MRLYPLKRGSVLQRCLSPVVIVVQVVVIIAVLFFFGSEYVSHTYEQEQKSAVERAVQRSLTDCYAIEGFYPSGIGYLEEHYGLVIDRDRYVIDYQPVGSNIRPSVTVVFKGGVLFE